MPPTPINPRAAALVNSLVPVSAAVFDQLRPEDYLLIHGCRDSATRTTRRLLDTNGECFARIDHDPVLKYDVTAEILSPYGLANWHPGANLTTAKGGIPALAFSNGEEAFGMIGGQLIYEAATRTRVPGDLPGIEFTVVREFADERKHGFPLPSVESVTTLSWPETVPPVGARYDLITGQGQIWVRRYNLVGPVTGVTFLDDVLEWHSLPATEPYPGSLALFLDGRPPETTGENEIEEVFFTDVPGGRALRAGTGIISGWLASGYSLPDTGGEFGYIYSGTFESEAAAPQDVSYPGPLLTTIEEFVAAFRSPEDDPGKIGTVLVEDVYSRAAGAWLPAS